MFFSVFSGLTPLPSNPFPKVGVITDENSRDLLLDLSFLKPGKTYEATLYRDAPTGDWVTNPEAYVIEKKPVTAKTKLMLHLAKGAAALCRLWGGKMSIFRSGLTDKTRFIILS
ncbi:glycoside hydrolase family 97 C-terminal domain-containing protein [Spirosoma radiotolerans]|uniref:glycoside hydrolase family 97 C-terminal domain-containing protein n=1 Tax=Spirosoma radiotolerans TaxID=1379870 RepID=UPI0011DD3E48|nr:glycoside hydrolase family 97 C-terminal domain-containing protein [Spirosoma radiotolerans]